jgi:trehalose 6-phosphate phosphatase
MAHEAELPPVLRPLRERCAEAALFLDYDGTLAPIVADPAGARPVPGVRELLARLGARLDLVAVVSGRPVRFLSEALGTPPGVVLSGLYGMEEVGRDGELRRDTGAQRWRPVVAEAVAVLAGSAPPGVEIEPKGLSVTLHWRRSPGSEGWARAAADALCARTGLVPQSGRMALELRPPVHVDKGTVVARLGLGRAVVACFGDDLGDLPAFAAVAELGRSGATIARVAVADAESPPEVAAAADVVVEGPEAAVALIERIAAD